MIGSVLAALIRFYLVIHTPMQLLVQFLYGYVSCNISLFYGDHMDKNKECSEWNLFYAYSFSSAVQQRLEESGSDDRFSCIDSIGCRCDSRDVLFVSVTTLYAFEIT